MNFARNMTLYLRFTLDILGFTRKQWGDLSQQYKRLGKWVQEQCPKALPKKVFKQTHSNLPELSIYNKILPASYWSSWTKKRYEDVCDAKSWLNPRRLYELAMTLGLHEKEGRLVRTMEKDRRSFSILKESRARKKYQRVMRMAVKRV